MTFNIFSYNLIKELYHDHKVIMYRARPIDSKLAENSQSVIIKLLSVNYPTAQDLLEFRHQYMITKNLNLSGILYPYNLESCGRGYAMIMEDFDGIFLDQYCPKLSIPDVLNIAIQMSDILQSLCQQKIIHKDIKPANLLIQPDTKQIKLVNFSIAALAPAVIFSSPQPHEKQELISPRSLEGTPAYLAPEQTGRINRRIDYRSDFYSLGVTLYELLTGQLPFIVEDPIDLIHCHLAQVPISAHLVNETIPPIIAQIVAKLMAKNSEDRYQSALGLKHDLEKCLIQWQKTGEITDFILGQQDISDRFIIPEKLYGRETEVKALLDAFDRVSSHERTELMLVAGFSGIGKTAVINEIQKPITREHGYFIKGKFDQFNSNTPLSAFVQVFQDLLRQILSESDAKVANWCNRILEAIGDNGQILVELIPELEQIIGKQTVVEELSGTSLQNRFNCLFIKFVEVFTTVNHPLVIFLDDLQWADSASLQLIKLLMIAKGHLLLLGAYRDNEVSPTHPLQLMITELKQSEAIVQDITLSPLAFRDTNQLISDTLNGFVDKLLLPNTKFRVQPGQHRIDYQQADLTQPLTELIYQKTQGNPFFITQFLKALKTDGEIRFNPKGYWECDIRQLQALAITDDVVEFMVAQLQKLPAETQQVLQIAACIGNQFDLSTLSISTDQPLLTTATNLWKSLQAGLVVPAEHTYKALQSETSSLLESTQNINPTYQFLHDRVQQAAYSLIPESQKQRIHLQIGRLLLANTQIEQQPEKIFEIVNHFNVAINMLNDQSEILMLAELNLYAAQKSRATTAYNAAFSYAQIGAKLLGESAWQQQYQLTLLLYETLAEAAFLQGNFSAVPSLIKEVLDHTKIPIDRVKVYEILIHFHAVQKQYAESITCGLEILKQLGVKISPQPNKLIIIRELIKAKIAMWGKSNQQLLDLPESTAPDKIAILRIMDILQIPAFFCTQELMVVLSLVGIQLTLRYGNTPWAASFYATYCIIISSLGKLKQAYRIGQLANILADRFANSAISARVKVVVPWYSQPWQEPLRTTIPIVDESLRMAINSGTLQYIGINAGVSITTRLYAGVSLNELVGRIAEIKELIIQSKDENSRQFFELLCQTIMNLHKTAEQPTQIVDNNDLTLISQWQASNEAIILSTLYSFKTLLAYLFGDISNALIHADAQLQYEYSAKGGYSITRIWMFDALTRLAAYPQSDKRVQKQLLKRVNYTQNQLKKRAQLMPDNFQHQYDLVTAEKCRVLADFTQAIELYDRAIAGAKHNEYCQEEALANELAAKFYLEWGKDNIATTYMQESYRCYLHWGAMAKTDDLAKRYPHLLNSILSTPQASFFSTLAKTTHSSTVITNHYEVNTFDLVAAIRSAQSLSSIVELPNLISKLCQILLKNSGAAICIPILLNQHKISMGEASSLKQHDTWQVYNIDATDLPDKSGGEGAVKLTCSPLEEYSDLPLKLINKVRYCRETVILGRSMITDPAITDDEYLQTYQPESVMCLPLINRGELQGIVYLENRYTANLFTPDQQIILEFLASQAVNSLQNAQLNESFALRSAAVEASVDGIAIIENDQFIYINHSQAQMFGYTVAELQNKSWKCLHSPEQVEFFQTKVFPIISMSGQWRGEVMATRKDGSTFYEEVTLSVLKSGQIICLSRDISERKAMEVALRKSEESYAQMVANVPAALYQFQIAADGTGKLNYLSARFSELFEISAAAALADSSVLFDRVISEDRESFDQSFQTAAITRQSWAWQGRILTPSGIVKWIRGESRPTTTIDGYLLWDGILIDVTEQQTALYERQQAQIDLHLTNERLELIVQELQRATRLKDEFLATMSHELRTPLNAILGMSEVLQEGLLGSLNSQQINSVSTIEQSGEHLLSLINDVLDVSKISVGKLELNVTKVSLVELCKSSLMFVKQQAINKQIQIDTNLPTDLDYLLVDERRIRQVLINLLNNAVKFTPNGGTVILSVQLESPVLCHQTTGYSLCFSVIDTGIGIAQDDISKLFQPFIQLDSNLNRKYAGTGLGLVLVKQIAELHGGYVSIDSEVGKGSCFKITIPQTHLKFGESLITNNINDLMIDQSPFSLHRTPLILLAEDNEVNINTFSSYLTTKGYRILLAQNGKDAIDLAQNYHPDLILMDVQMPDMSGIEAIECIRKQSQETSVPIIVLTAQAMAGDREKCLATGANQYLTKPVKLRKLHQSIQKHLDLN
jgi:PAS domain S-box-containing protein